MSQKQIQLAICYENSSIMRAYQFLFHKNGELHCLISTSEFDKLCSDEKLHDCDLVILEANPENTAKIEECRKKLRTHYPGLKLILDGTFKTDLELSSLLKLQVRSIIHSEHMQASDLCATLRNVHNNGYDFLLLEKKHKSLSDELIQYAQGIPPFKTKHWKVLNLLVLGRKKTEIAKQVGVGRWSINEYVKQMIQITESKDEAELIAKAIRNGWIDH